MVNNLSDKKAEKTPSEQAVIYTPQEGHSYSHHAAINYFNGKFYAVWSNGFEKEDDCGQRVMMAHSEDGLSWSEPVTVADPAEDGYPNRVYTSCGLYINGGTMNLYYGAFDYKEDRLTKAENRPNMTRVPGDSGHENVRLWCKTSADGINFSVPIDMGLKMVANHAPKRLSDGRLIIAGGVMYPYTDNPDAIHGYKISGVYGDYFGESDPVDDSESIFGVTKYLGWEKGLLCEGAFYEMKDRIRLLFRSNTDILFYSDSFDRGVKWSVPAPSDFHAAGSKFCCLTLSDGRIMCIYSPERTNRIPLVASFSDDGENFGNTVIIRDEPRTMIIPGMYKGGVYGYPDAIEKDEYVYVVYSVNKEGVEVSRFSGLAG